MYNGQLQTDIFRTNQSVDPFGDNLQASQAYKQAERLVTATFLITSNVPYTNVLNTQIRDNASKLLTDVLNLRKGFNVHGEHAISDILARIRLLMSFLDAMYMSGYISDTNLKILKDAYINFAGKLNEMSKADMSDQIDLSKEYFDSEMVAPASQTLTSQNHAKNKAFVTHRTTDPKHTASKPNTVTKTTVKDRVATTTPMLDTRAQRRSRERINNIIEVLKRRGNMSVSDIAGVITGVSNKTIQRDLNHLVSQGTVTRSGSKRWTKYSLV